MSNQTQNSKSKGFSLIEMLVVVLIFTIVMGIAVGVFTSALKLQKYNLAYQQLLSQVNYAMEYMDRSIRMAVKDNGTCGFSGQNYRLSDFNRKIEFRNYRGECQQFYWDTTINPNQLMSFNSAIYASSLNLTSSDFTITRLNFYVAGDAPNNQPKVTIVMEIEAKTTVLPKPKIKILTTVSQRNLNIS